MIASCKKVDVNFSVTPEAPRAGESVRFSNLSSSGEEWEWTFGDGGTSTLKSPTHVYRRAGTYRVSLKVDKKNSLVATRELTVFDTVPTYVCKDSVFEIYRDYTFTANVYNPYNYAIGYAWEVRSTDGMETALYELKNPEKGLNEPTLDLYFVRPAEVELALWVVLNGDTTHVAKTFPVKDRATNSVVMRLPDSDYRQRIFGSRAEQVRPLSSPDALLDAEQDTAQTYNGKEFRLSELQEVFPELKGFHIANRKIYYRADGLWVASIDGADPVQIDEADCLAMTLDTYDNRIYWANSEGVWFMPFVGSDNNKFVTTPTQLNTLLNVQKIAADSEPK